MRYGFTTGSCAAAAAKAATYMLLMGKKKTEITIETPKGIPYTTEILQIKRREHEVSCAVEKDGGDDPDITTGAMIYAKVSYGEEAEDGVGIQSVPRGKGADAVKCPIDDAVAVDDHEFHKCASR